MSSEDLFEEVNEESEPEISDVINIVQNIIKHRHIVGPFDGTFACFHVFHTTIQNYIHNNSTEVDLSNLNILSVCIKQLREAELFDNNVFSSCVMRLFFLIPLEVLGWLQSNNIITIAEYCKERMPDIISDLINIIGNREPFPNIFNVERICVDVLDELVCGAYAPRLGICRLSRSKMWCDYCKNALDDLTTRTIKAAILNKQTNFLVYLKYVTERLNRHATMYEYFFINMLIKFLKETDKFSIYSCYKFQYLFEYENMEKNVLLIFDTMFSFYDVEELFKIMENSDCDNINWKYVLHAISIAIRKYPDNSQKVKEKAAEYLDNTFKGGKIKEFTKAIILLRQVDKNYYKTWYSEKFGIDTQYKTSTNSTFFKYLLECLTHLCVHEPMDTLQIHVDLSLKAPPKCNSLIFDYKGVARAQLDVLSNSPAALLNGSKIPIIHLLEECKEQKCISPFVKLIFSKQTSHVKKLIFQQTQNKEFSFLEQLFMAENMELPSHVSDGEDSDFA